MQTVLFDVERTGATLSPCRTYRYSLWRDWGDPRRAILAAVSGAPRIVCAWGLHGAQRERGPQVARQLRQAGANLYRLPVPLTANGQPVHPLYKPEDGQLVPWPGA